tara:strand:+ start:7138 stop:7416 length:279 start_codon:yes stop_codon:yes gene_type:complete
MSESAEKDEPATPRELTVGQLIERLREYPEHHYVSPMVDGVLGAGIDVWQMFDPQTHDTLVVFGESKPPTPAIVPPHWSGGDPSTPAEGSPS